MDEDSEARRRLLLYTAVRLGGLIIFFFGIVIGFSNLFWPGGWPQVGAILIIIGAIDAVLAPRMLKKAWDRNDQDRR